MIVTWGGAAGHGDCARTRRERQGTMACVRVWGRSHHGVVRGEEARRRSGTRGVQSRRGLGDCARARAVKGGALWPAYACGNSHITARCAVEGARRMSRTREVQSSDSAGLPQLSRR